MDLEQLRQLCLSFPNAAEDVKWGKDLCFLIGGKMFCVAGMDEASGQISFKCTPERFAELIERPGIIPAPYVARYNWVAVEDKNALTDEEYEDLISRSYLLVFENLPAKDRKNLQRT